MVTFCKHQRVKKVSLSSICYVEAPLKNYKHEIQNSIIIQQG